MATQTFRTNTKTIYLRLIKWFLIATGALVIIANGYKFIYGLDVNYLNLFTGVCILVMGLFSKNYFGNISVTIGDDVIHYHRSKTGIRPEEEQNYSWDSIKKVILDNRHIRVVEHNTTNSKFRLPYYTNYQFQEIKEQLQNKAETHNMSFKVRSWW